MTPSVIAVFSQTAGSATGAGVAALLATTGLGIGK
jgi:hypothetical protein